jgi:hypothetical protein
MSEQNVRTEEFRVEGDDLLAKVRELVREGDIRRITLKDDSSPVAVKGQMC